MRERQAFLKNRGGREGREININLLFHLFMHSLFTFCMCPDWRSNLPPWLIGMTLQPTEQPGQGTKAGFIKWCYLALACMAQVLDSIPSWGSCRRQPSYTYRLGLAVSSANGLWRGVHQQTLRLGVARKPGLEEDRNRGRTQQRPG